MAQYHRVLVYLDENWTFHRLLTVRGITVNIKFESAGAIRIFCWFWNQTFPNSILLLNKRGGLSSADLNAQLLRNRLSWQEVPHIANLGVFNQGVGLCDHSQGLCKCSSNLTARASWEAENLQCYELAIWQPPLEDYWECEIRSAVAAINHATSS